MPNFPSVYNEIQRGGLGSAAAYFEAIKKISEEDISLFSNDILGIEYIKEIMRRGLTVEPLAVKRVGDGYRDEVAESDFASATAIRKILISGNEADRYLPTSSLESLLTVVKSGEAPVESKNIECALLAFWRMVNPASLADIAELGNGLEYRLKDAALSSSSLEEFENNAATKKHINLMLRYSLRDLYKLERNA